MIQTHTLAYRNWTTILWDAELDPREVEEAEADLDCRGIRWGVAPYTLIEPELAGQVLCAAIRAYNPDTLDTRERCQMVLDSIAGQLVNLEK